MRWGTLDEAAYLFGEQYDDFYGVPTGFQSMVHAFVTHAFPLRGVSRHLDGIASDMVKFVILIL